MKPPKSLDLTAKKNFHKPSAKPMTLKLLWGNLLSLCVPNALAPAIEQVKFIKLLANSAKHLVDLHTAVDLLLHETVN